MHENEISHKIIGACIEVHRHLGPGLLESVYEEAVCHELGLIGLLVERQVQVPLQYKGVDLRHALRLDLLVERKVILELKAKDKLTPIDTFQLTSYLRLSDKRLGLLINFNVARLVDGLVRVANGLAD